MKPQKLPTLTEKMRENPYILATFILGVLVLILITYNFFQADMEVKALTSPEELCDKAQVTPSWFNWIGDLVDTGYKPIPENVSLDEINKMVDKLINDKIYFVYSSQCGACKQQIEDFREAWIEYQDSGFTVNCAEVNQKII